MTDEHDEALAALMRVFDERLAAAPLVKRRATIEDRPIEARRAKGPVAGDFAYWIAPRDRDRR